MAHPNDQAARNVIALIRQQTGKRFAHLETELGSLSVMAIAEVGNLLRDLENSKTSAVRSAKLTPWR